MELLFTGSSLLVPLEGRQMYMEQSGNNRRQAVMERSEWCQGQGFRPREDAGLLSLVFDSYWM